MPLTANAGEPLAGFDVAEDMSRFVFASAPAEIDQVMLGMSGGYGVRLQIELGGWAADADGEEDHTERDSGFQVGPAPTSEPHEAG